MKKIITTMLFAGLMSGFTTSQAELTANAALTSDYIWRGISQSASDPALQGGLDYTHSTGLYAGIWGSNVDWWEPVDGGTSNGEDIEIDVYGGYAGDTGGMLAYDIGFIHYIYPDTTTTDSDFTEVYMGATVKIFSAKFSYSNDFANSGNTAWYMEGGIDYEFSSGYASGYTLSFHAGKSDGDNFSTGGTDYVDYSLGVSKEYKGFNFDLTYYDTDLDGANLDVVGANQNDDAVVLSVSKDFDIF